MELPDTQEIKKTFIQWSTEYLISIWLANERDEYREEAYAALREILLKRGARLTRPGEPVSYQGKEFKPIRRAAVAAPRRDFENPPLPSDDKLVPVAVCYNLFEADLLKSRLEAEGISVSLLGDNLIHMNWLYSRAIGGIRIQVQERDAGRAKEIIRLLDDSQLEISFGKGAVNCPNCGSADIRLKKRAWKIAFVAFFFFCIPLPFRKNIAVCNSCGYRWKSLKNIIEPPRKNSVRDSEEWICSECGADVVADTLVCQKCGADVSDIEED